MCPGSKATIAFSDSGAAIPLNQPYLPLLEWVISTAGPVCLSSSAIVFPMNR